MREEKTDNPEGNSPNGESPRPKPDNPEKQAGVPTVDPALYGYLRESADIKDEILHGQAETPSADDESEGENGNKKGH
jgi:hypothetical protein